MFDDLLLALTWLAVTVLAVAGALTASRKQLDPVGFMLVACLCAFGGGTVRDVILNQPVFWLAVPEMVALAAGLALVVFFAAHRLERRFVVLLWADAVGLGLFAVLGAEAAQRAGVAPWAAILMGTITATAGGILRDIICAEVPLVLRREIYATAAALGAARRRRHRHRLSRDVPVRRRENAGPATRARLRSVRPVRTVR